MNAFNENHLQLVHRFFNEFAKLTQILAETFQDIHSIFLNEINNESNGNQEKKFPAEKEEKTLSKQQWLDKENEVKPKSKSNSNNDDKEGEDIEISEELEAKPVKQKKKNKNNDDAVDVKEKKKKKIAKWEQEGKPKPPLNAFMLFLKDTKSDIMEAKPELTPSEVSSYASGLWNELGEEEKERYKLEYKANRLKYDEEVKEKEKEKEKEKLLLKGQEKIGENTNKNGKDILDIEANINDDNNDSDSMSGI